MSGQGFVEYNPISVHQMVGRAGRPQFDTFARAVIMTKMENKFKYETLLFGKQVIESKYVEFMSRDNWTYRHYSLHKRMIEHFNAEISLETLTSIEGAKEWLKSTYLFVRIKKNPTHYNLPRNLTDELLEKNLEGTSHDGSWSWLWHRVEMCTNCLHELRDAGMIEMNGPGDIKATEIGKSMAKFCVSGIFASWTTGELISGRSTLILWRFLPRLHQLLMSKNYYTYCLTLASFRIASW